MTHTIEEPAPRRGRTELRALHLDLEMGGGGGGGRFAEDSTRG